MKRVKVAKQFRDYMRRIKSYVGRQHPLKMQAAAPGKLARAVRGLRPPELRPRPRPCDRDWGANPPPSRPLPMKRLLERVRLLREENVRLLKSVPRPWWNR